MGTRINPNARFDRERKRAKQDEGARQQQVKEAISRKFASQGLTGSGADLKITQQSADEGARRLDDRFEGIAGAEEQSAFQQQQIADARKFQTAERESTQGFASAESKLAREQQQAQFEKQLKTSVEQFGVSSQLQKDQIALQETLQEFQIGTDGEGGILQQQMDLAFKELEASKSANVFSAMISAYNSKLTPNEMKRVLSPLGVKVDKFGSITYEGEVIFEAKTAEDSGTPTALPPGQVLTFE
jgi:hypothetical protein